MVDYSYSRRKSQRRHKPLSVERLRGEPIIHRSICQHPKPKNIAGDALDQLEECHFQREIEPYPNTLVIIVGNNIHKLIHTLKLYHGQKPPEPHDLILAYNGAGIHEFIDFLPEVPDNCIAEPIVMPNYGWDLGMYAQAVLNYKYDRYFFINDDVVSIGGNTWLAEFESEVARGCGFVGVQGHLFIRTSYYGATRLYWLSMLTAILSNCIQFSAHRFRRLLPRLRRAGAVDAYCFEASGKYFADRCGFKIGWLQSPHRFLDRNCVKYKMICASQIKDKPLPYLIDGLGNGLEERISVDYVINWARQHGLRDIH